jgi:hypothetical protein
VQGSDENLNLDRRLNQLIKRSTKPKNYERLLRNRVQGSDENLNLDRRLNQLIKRSDQGQINQAQLTLGLARKPTITREGNQ